MVRECGSGRGWGSGKGAGEEWEIDHEFTFIKYKPCNVNHGY